MRRSHSSKELHNMKLDWKQGMMHNTQTVQSLKVISFKV